MKIIGIDYGTKRVGVAISDDTASLAFPKAVLRNSHTLLGEIKSTIENNKVEKIVIGQSLDTDGSENILMEDIRRFASVLEKEVGLPIFLEPEFFTSQEAHKGKKAGEVSSHMIDAAAAALILQRFLDKEKGKG
ncbi:Holliday junction resolvase RuvX [Candidatus Kaiserbacteria bacterium]|nr:Holliday junction resolvase RuvX [Candidatus Kaiserbacteria bacterium]